LSLESHERGEAERRRQSGGDVEALQWSCAEIPPGSEERGTRAKGSPRNLGDPMDSAEKETDGPPEDKGPGLRALGSDHPWERRDGHRRGTAERRKRSEAGGLMGSRSALVVPVKRGNRPEGPRGGKGSTGDTEPLEGKAARTPVCGTVSTKLQRIAELARESPERAFLSLAHHVDVEFLTEAFRRTRKDGAKGVDGQSGRDYEERLEENLRSLLERFKSGRYKAPPVRRTFVPKGDGTRRPIGIPTFEDKVLQRAVVMVLETVYEQDFLGCSYGYRPGRSAHQALEELWRGLMDRRGGWVLELDIRAFFDSLDHSRLRRILDQRVRDGVLRRTIDKWLAAGVLEGEEVSHPDAGTPQGGVVSPLLANVYLHEALDTWFAREVRPQLKGRGQLVRFADDAVLVFSEEQDARRVMEALPQRLAQYGLSLHPEKTRLIHFRPPSATGGDQGGGRGKNSFDFLGFTHHWARSRRGFWVVKRKTAGSRFGRGLKRASEWFRRVRHQPVAWQHAQLERKLRGHYAYFGIPGNAAALGRFRYEVGRLWRKWLDRRSHKAGMTWERFERLQWHYPLPYPTRRSALTQCAANP
jgi:RNA-directed DNA polymerase